MSPPIATIKTAAGNHPVRAVDTFNPDVIERVRSFLEFSTTNNYQVSTPSRAREQEARPLESLC
jgi:hypothetical protein